MCTRHQSICGTCISLCFHQSPDRRAVASDKSRRARKRSRAGKPLAGPMSTTDTDRRDAHNSGSHGDTEHKSTETEPLQPQFCKQPMSVTINWTQTSTPQQQRDPSCCKAGIWAGWARSYEPKASTTLYGVRMTRYLCHPIQPSAPPSKSMSGQRDIVDASPVVV